MPFLLLALVFGAVVSIASFSEPHVSREVRATQLFVPPGFDDNDQVTVYLDGTLDNTCWKLAEPALSRRQYDTIAISLRAEWDDEKHPCETKSVPFTVAVPLGVLEAGRIWLQANSGILRKELHIREALRSEGPGDEALYAKVQEVEVERRLDGAYLKLTLRFTNTCVKLKQVELRDAVDGTIDVLPYLELTPVEESTGLPCQAIESTSIYRRKLPALEPGRYLLHARSLGQEAAFHAFTIHPLKEVSAK